MEGWSILYPVIYPFYLFIPFSEFHMSKSTMPIASQQPHRKLLSRFDRSDFDPQISNFCYKINRASLKQCLSNYVNYHTHSGLITLEHWLPVCTATVTELPPLIPAVVVQHMDQFTPCLQAPSNHTDCSSLVKITFFLPVNISPGVFSVFRSLYTANCGCYLSQMHPGA